MARKGFFKSSEIAAKKLSNAPKVAQCGKCKLYKTCKSPYMKPTGKNKIRILHIAEAPGAIEDRRNEQLVGTVGQFYRRIWKRIGVNIDDCVKTNANLCRPPNNEKPNKTRVLCCKPNLMQCIKEYNPHVIIPLGENALTSLIGHKFDKSLGGITKWRGFIIPDKEFNAWICPTFHPSYVTRETAPEYAEKLFIQDLKHAYKMLDVPLPKSVDHQGQIEFIKHHKDITHWLQLLVMGDVQLTAFDFEASGLKPHKDGHYIRTCAISCSPDHCVAFPVPKSKDFRMWLTRYLATNSIKKIVANLKFERDWSKWMFDIKINGIFFDTMIAAHFLDNRPKITSLDFNNYVNFGIEPYDRAVSKLLKTPNDADANQFNRIGEIDLESLMLYNGMDSKTEFMNALVMMDRIGIDYSHLYKGPTGADLAPQYAAIGAL